MNTRSATEAEERLVMAFHEAGHLVTTHFSSYFGLRDPAVEIKLSGPLSAVSGFTRVRDTSPPEHHQPSAREFVRIGLAGKATEDEFLRLQPSTGPRLIPNPDGANLDISSVRKTLQGMQMETEYDVLFAESTAIVKREWKAIQAVAEIIFHSSKTKIPREEILAVLPPKT